MYKKALALRKGNQNAHIYIRKSNKYYSSFSALTLQLHASCFLDKTPLGIFVTFHKHCSLKVHCQLTLSSIIFFSMTRTCAHVFPARGEVHIYRIWKVSMTKIMTV